MIFISHLPSLLKVRTSSTGSLLKSCLPISITWITTLGQLLVMCTRGRPSSPLLADPGAKASGPHRLIRWCGRKLDSLSRGKEMVPMHPVRGRRSIVARRSCPEPGACTERLEFVPGDLEQTKTWSGYIFRAQACLPGGGVRGCGSFQRQSICGILYHRIECPASKLCYQAIRVRRFVLQTPTRDSSTGHIRCF